MGGTELSDRISYLRTRLLISWRTLMMKPFTDHCQSHKACSIQILLCASPFSATCSPTSLCGGTVSPSWRLHSSVCPTCICMNWETCGRSSSMWQWGPSWPFRSDWGNRWEKRQTIMSDKDWKHKGQSDLQSDVSHVPWKCRRRLWTACGQSGNTQGKTTEQSSQFKEEETKNVPAPQWSCSLHPSTRGQWQSSVWTWRKLCCSPSPLWNVLDRFWELSALHHCLIKIFTFASFKCSHSIGQSPAYVQFFKHIPSCTN